MKCKKSCRMKISTERRNQEFGIKPKKTLSGKKMLKTKCQKIKKAKKPIQNGKRNPNFQSRKLGKMKMRKRRILPDRTGA
jgi:hypothetical protein